MARALSRMLDERRLHLQDGPIDLIVTEETVTLRIDSDVLAVFQADGSGWQDRINAALRKVAGL